MNPNAKLNIIEGGIINKANLSSLSESVALDSQYLHPLGKIDPNSKFPFLFLNYYQNTNVKI
jgi:hypothetical protein